jgi:hypothetical protein
MHAWLIINQGQLSQHNAPYMLNAVKRTLFRKRPPHLIHHFYFTSSLRSIPPTLFHETLCLTASCGTTPCAMKISTNPCNGSISFFGSKS